MIKIVAVFLMLFFQAFSKPQSGVSEVDGYQMPCFLTRIGIESVAKYTKINNPSSAAISDAEAITSGTTIYAVCKDNYYVFDETNKTGNPRKTFGINCVDGSFRKVKATDYCDERCVIVDLARIGYGIPKNILNPGEKVTVSCPTGKITAEGENFEIACGNNGMLSPRSSACFTKSTACWFGARWHREGSKLTCNDNGIAFVSCENGSWEEQGVYDRVKNTCKETISDVEFAYDDLNQLSIDNNPLPFTLAELQEFCKANPNDPSCQAKLNDCEHKGVKYAFGTGINIRCKNYEQAIMQFQCMEDWSFIKFLDPNHPLANSTFGSYEQCPPADSDFLEVISSENMANSVTESNSGNGGGDFTMWETRGLRLENNIEEKPKTFKEFYVNKWKEYKKGMLEGEVGRKVD